MFGKKILWRGLAALFLSILVLAITGYGIADAWRGFVDTALGTASYITTSEVPDGEEPAFKSDFATTSELVREHVRIGQAIGEEGSVLLKNETAGSAPALPLAKGARVTLLGMPSYRPEMGGRMGSGNAANDGTTSIPEGVQRNLIDALKEKGFNVNPAMVSIYEELARTPSNLVQNLSGGFSVGDNGYGAMAGGTIPKFTISEPSPSVYNEAAAAAGVNGDYKSSFANYNDAAIVVIARPSREAGDYYPGALGVDQELYGTTNSLGLSINEKAVIQLAKDNFRNVIILINSNSAMEIDELKNDSRINAILWVGTPNNYGFLGVANILNGDANPSGRLPNIYAVNSASSPAMMNYGVHWYTNRDLINIPETEQNIYTAPGVNYTDLRAAWYLVYAEGIYTGYKYYETRYADSVEGNGNASSAKGASFGASSWRYQNEVSYSFGYGLSYTTFTQTLNSVTVRMANRTVTASVTVRNTGNVAGANAVQLYVQTPYTQYDISNKVEKSAVEFIGAEKTRILNPGESQTVEITVPMKYIASYDYTKAKTYIMDWGDYYFALGNGAHDALNNILAAKGKTTANGMTYNGNSALAEKWTYSGDGEADNVTFSRSDNGTLITNQIADGDLNYYLPGEVTYLSRSNWDATYPKTYVITLGGQRMSQWIMTLRNMQYEIRSDASGNETIFGRINGLVLSDLAGIIDISDPRWSQLANQLTQEEVLFNIAGGGNHCAVITSVGSPLVWQTDGPNGFNNNGAQVGVVGRANTTDPGASRFVSLGNIDGYPVDPNLNYRTGTLPNAPMMAATFNTALIKDAGRMVGNDSLWIGHTILWGAGMNTHRTPYSGRNHEYYSECAMLTNIMGTAFIQGGNEYGAINSPKHFAFNCQEGNRVGVAPYMNEQRAREGDLRAFQGAFEEGATLGVMTTFSRIGATAFNGHTGIMQNILRGEWGFKGLVTTDMVNGNAYFRPELSIIGGITMMAQNTKSWSEGAASITGRWPYFTASRIAQDANLMAHAKQNIMYQLYALANSNAANFINYRVTPWWESMFISLIVISAVLLAVSAVMYVIISLKRKEEN